MELFAFRSFRIRLDTSVGAPAFGETAAVNLRAWPSPSRNGTTVAFELKRAARGTLAVHDAFGRLVRTRVEGSFAGATHRVRRDGTDRQGSRVAAGVHYSRLETDRLRATEKIVLLR